MLFGPVCLSAYSAQSIHPSMPKLSTYLFKYLGIHKSHPPMEGKEKKKKRKSREKKGASNAVRLGKAMPRLGNILLNF